MLRVGKKFVDDMWGVDSFEYYGKLIIGEGEMKEI